jgi:ABC-type transport system involved in multi-copper enzyme maturation permease subunit
MKGLIKNNLYSTLGNIKVFLLIDIVLILFLLATGNETLLYAVSLSTTPFLALLATTCLVKEETSKWHKHKLSFPVTRRTIINSQFIHHLFWIMAGVIIVITAIVLTILIHGNLYFCYNFRDAIAVVVSGFIVALLIGAFVYPMLYLLGTDRAVVILALGVIVSVGVVFGISRVINSFVESPMTDVQFYMYLSIETIVALIIYALSYFLTTIIFSKKEY